MSRLQWVPGPSRVNDRMFTLSALHAALAACRGTDLLEAVGRVSLALASTEALYVDARTWDEWQAVDRACGRCGPGCRR